MDGEEEQMVTEEVVKQRRSSKNSRSVQGSVDFLSMLHHHAREMMIRLHN